MKGFLNFISARVVGISKTKPAHIQKEEQGVKKKLGRHIIAEIYVSNPEVLEDEREVMEALKNAAVEGGMTVISSSHHKFTPQGFTGFVLLAESHISIHTWPEHSYAAVDIFSCGESDPLSSLQHLKEKLGITKMKVIDFDRGLF